VLSSRSDDAMTKAIFLDVGGTLLEMGDPESAYADILDQYGYPSTREQIGAWIRKAQEETGPVVSSGSGSGFKVSAREEQARREKLIAVFLRQAGVRKHFDSCQKGIWDSWVSAPVFRLFPEKQKANAPGGKTRRRYAEQPTDGG